MNVNALKAIGKQTGDYLMKNSPTILTGLSVGGLVTTSVLASMGTSRAIPIIRDAEEQREKDARTTGFELNPLSRMDKVKLTWKCYAPAAAMGLATVACIVGANSIHLRRNAALAGAYSLVDAAFKEYQSKVVEVMGEKKEEKIHDEIAQDRLNKNPLNNNQIILTGLGETLCYDSLSGRYFKCDIEKIRRIQNEFNLRVINGMHYGNLNELYDDLGLEGTELGKNMGWNIDRGLLDIHFSSKLATNDQPCLVLEFRPDPQPI